MLPIFLQTLPFFALIAVGYVATRTGFFSEEATAYLTRFVFYFALSAMLFRFSANLSLSEVFDGRFVVAYLWGSAVAYLIATTVAFYRGLSVAEAAVEAQSSVIGNVGFLGIPMFVLLIGEHAIGPVMLVLAVDLLVFGSLIVVLITGSRDGRLSPAILLTVGRGLLANPMLVSIALGFGWSATGMEIPGPANAFLSLLGGAATPVALFVIGASLASKSAERLVIAGWISVMKLFVHPALVALSAIMVFKVNPTSAGIMIACASLPVAGNVFILAQHYGVAPARVSAAILVSTVISVVTVSVVIAWIATI